MTQDISNEIECPNCGERLYIEVLVCPKCGLHFYPEDEGEQKEADKAPARSNLKLAGGWVVAGTMVAGGLAFILHRLASFFWPLHQGTGFQVMLWVAGPIGTLVGGYLVACLTRRKVLFQGLIVGIMSLFPAYFLEAYWRDLSVQPLGIATLTSWAVMVIGGMLGAWVWNRLDQSTGHQVLSQPNIHLDEQKLYFELLAQVRHDIDTAERLVNLERRRKPTLSRAALIQNALDRLERDRR